jgi:hypothetical protein
MKLRVRIARGRSYAFVLVTPQRKTSLCEALQGRAAMGVEAPWAGHGELAGEERGGRLGGFMGRGRAAGGAPGLQPPACLLAVRCVLNVLSVVREKEEGRKREEKRRKEKKRGKKEKNMEIFLNLKIFKEKNKRQFMKLVKKLFLYKKEINLIIIK